MKPTNHHNNIDNLVPKIIFHYTTFEKFVCILRYGTWRFKLSTKSNDLLDTVYIVNLIKNDEDIINNISDNQNSTLRFMKGYFERNNYRSTYLSYVSCFTRICDSRLFWDAYTVNNDPENRKGDYNGVCIAINRDKLFEILQSKLPENCVDGILLPIFYKSEKQKKALTILYKRALNLYENLKFDKDQKQDLIPPIKFNYSLSNGEHITQQQGLELIFNKPITYSMLAFIESIEKTAPFLKHEFWEEEKEYRASLIFRRNNPPKENHIDIQINEELINHVILGPTFLQNEIESIHQIPNPKLNFDDLRTEPSKGTGIIQKKS